MAGKFFQSFLWASVALFAAFSVQAQTGTRGVQVLSDSDISSFNNKFPGCKVDIVKLPENKTVGIITNSISAYVKIGNVTTQQYVHFRNTKEVKFGGLTVVPGGDFVVEATLVKTGDEGLCQPVGCRSFPAKLVMDVSAGTGKYRAIESDVLLQDKCGNEPTKRLLN